MATRKVIGTDINTGVIIFDEVLSDKTYLANNTGATLTSNYTQSGSIPGNVTKVSGQTLVPVVTNAQSTDTLTLEVKRSGYPGRVGITYSTDGGTTDIGHMSPLSVHGWEPIAWSDAITYDAYSAVVVPSTQTMHVAYATSGSGSVYLTTWNGTTWSAATEITTTAANAIGLLVTPDESKLILIHSNTSDKINTYFSDDSGATWSQLASVAETNITLTTSCTRITCCYIGSQIAMIASATANDAYHYASSTDGTSWDLIEAIDYSTDATGLKISPLRTATGAVVSFADYNSTDTAHTSVSAAIITSAYDVIYQRAANNFDSEVYRVVGTLPTSVTSCCDWDGSIYLIASYGTSINYIWKSTDLGVTWNPTSGTVGEIWYQTGDTATRPNNLQAYPCNGNIYVFGNHTANPGNEDGSLSVFKLGGWSELEFTENPTHVYTPFDLPADVGWTAGGTTAPTIGSAGYLRFLTTGTNGYDNYIGASTSLTPAAHFTMFVQLGGSGSASDIVAALIACDASNTYHASLWFTTTGFKVMDQGSGSTEVAAISYDMTTDAEFIIAWESAGNLYLAWKRPYEVEWTTSTTVNSYSFSTSGVGSANWLFTMGHGTATTSDSRWKWVTLYSNLGTVLDGAGRTGKTLSGAPYPLPVENSNGDTVFLSTTAGQGLNGETYTIVPNYTYPIDNIWPALSPSPRKEWRSTSTAEQVITFNLSNRTHIGNAIAVLFQKVNFKTAYLEYYDGSNWVTAATYNGAIGFEDLEFTRTGEVVFPDTSVTSHGSRMLQMMEMEDGWIEMASDYRHVARHSQGFWNAGTDTVKPNIVFSGLDSTEPSSGTMSIVADGGILFYYPTSEQIRQYWRIRIPTQNCPDSYFKAGIIAVGSVMPFGQDFGWGWQDNVTPQFESFVTRSGTEYRNELGDPIRTWNFAFTDGISHNQVRGLGTIDASYNAAYVATSTGLKLQVVGSNYFQMQGTIARTNSYSIPIVVTDCLPASNTTLTDKSHYLYGYFDGSVATSYVSGTEGKNETVRIETIQVKGIV